MCPGEVGTIWRESDVSLSVKSKVYKDLNPNQRAIYSLVIKNESPYREGGSFAIRLMDGKFMTIDAMRSAAYEAAEAAPADAANVLASVQEAAKSAIGEFSDDVLRILLKANESATSYPNDAFQTADAVSSAAQTSAPVNDEFADEFPHQRSMVRIRIEIQPLLGRGRFPRQAVSSLGVRVDSRRRTGLRDEEHTISGDAFAKHLRDKSVGECEHVQGPHRVYDENTRRRELAFSVSKGDVYGKHHGQLRLPQRFPGCARTA